MLGATVPAGAGAADCRLLKVRRSASPVLSYALFSHRWPLRARPPVYNAVSAPLGAVRVCVCALCTVCAWCVCGWCVNVSRLSLSGCLARSRAPASTRCGAIAIALTRATFTTALYDVGRWLLSTAGRYCEKLPVTVYF